MSGCKIDVHVQKSGHEMCACAGVSGVRYVHVQVSGCKINVRAQMLWCEMYACAGVRV